MSEPIDRAAIIAQINALELPMAVRVFRPMLILKIQRATEPELKTALAQVRGLWQSWERGEHEQVKIQVAEIATKLGIPNARATIDALVESQNAGT